MTYRRCRNPHRTDGLTHQQVVELAMEKLQWSKAKVLSWMEKENASLNKARPRELVDRGQTELIEELLDKREKDRKKEQEGKK
jgi:hypothetical protein